MCQSDRARDWLDAGGAHAELRRARTERMQVVFFVRTGKLARSFPSKNHPTAGSPRLRVSQIRALQSGGLDRGDRLDRLLGSPDIVDTENVRSFEHPLDDACDRPCVAVGGLLDPQHFADHGLARNRQ